MERTPRATDTDGLLLGDLAPGARVGEYLIEAVLATRGTGHIYQAVHRVLPRRVVVKVMPAMTAGMQAVALELLREACIVEAIDHPGVPRVYECGMLADKRPWTATELIDGTSLAARQQRGDVTVHDAAAIVRDVAEVLENAHARGLVHRNVVPAAIVFPAQPRRFPLCLVDWSGARTRDSRTPLRSPVDARADVYALGVIARDLLRRTDAVRPPIFAALVSNMLDDDPAARPTAASVREVARWLVEAIEDGDVEDAEVASDQAIPASVLEERTEVMRVITSESAPTVSGELVDAKR